MQYLRAYQHFAVDEYSIKIRFSSTGFSTKIAQFSFSFSRFPFFDIIFYNLDVCDSPVTAGVSLFFLRPPDFLGAGWSVVFAVDLSLADFLSEVFFADGFLLAVFFAHLYSDAGSAVSAGALLCCSASPSSTLAIVSAEMTLALYSK